MHYTDSDVTGLDKSKLKIAYWDEKLRLWRVIMNSISYPLENKVVASIDHFTLFAVVEFNPSSGKNKIVDIYNYPNPFKVDTGTTIRYILSEQAIEVKIRIYNVQGRLIKELDGTTAPDVNDVFWNAKNHSGNKVPADVFIGIIEANFISGGKETKKFKLTGWK
jgi:hypothetical protein